MASLERLSNGISHEWLPFGDKPGLPLRLSSRPEPTSEIPSPRPRASVNYVKDGVWWGQGTKPVHRIVTSTLARHVRPARRPTSSAKWSPLLAEAMRMQSVHVPVPS